MCSRSCGYEFSLILFQFSALAMTKVPAPFFCLPLYDIQIRIEGTIATSSRFKVIVVVYGSLSLGQSDRRRVAIGNLNFAVREFDFARPRRGCPGGGGHGGGNHGGCEDGGGRALAVKADQDCHPISKSPKDDYEAHVAIINGQEGSDTEAIINQGCLVLKNRS